MNVKTSHQQISTLLRAISQPARIEILLAIGTGEACVCHLEAAIGQRQAYISQQLMALREAGIVIHRRDGRNIFYRLKDPAILELLQQAGKLSGVDESDPQIAGLLVLPEKCPCPNCEPEMVVGKPEQTIQLDNQP